MSNEFRTHYGPPRRLHDFPTSGSSGGSSCVCLTGSYTPTILSFSGFSLPPTPFAPSQYTVMDNIVTVYGVLNVTNTGVNDYAFAEIDLPISPAVTPMFGSGAFWNQQGVGSAVILPAQLQATSMTTIRISIGLIPDDGGLTYSFRYTI